MIYNSDVLTTGKVVVLEQQIQEKTRDGCFVEMQQYLGTGSHSSSLLLLFSIVTVPG